MSEDLDKEAMAVLLDKAVGEFKKTGEVIHTCCDSCGEPIKIEQIADDAYKVSCPCGKFWGSLRGL